MSAAFQSSVMQLRPTKIVHRGSDLSLADRKGSKILAVIPKKPVISANLSRGKGSSEASIL